MKCDDCPTGYNNDGDKGCTVVCKLVHTGDDAVGGDDKRWHIARQHDGVGQTSVIQDQTAAQCAAACSSTSWCTGFLHKHTDDHNCDSEAEFCNGACTLLENLLVAATSVDYVDSHTCVRNGGCDTLRKCVNSPG